MATHTTTPPTPKNYGAYFPVFENDRWYYLLAGMILNPLIAIALGALSGLFVTVTVIAPFTAICWAIRGLFTGKWDLSEFFGIN